GWQTYAAPLAVIDARKAELSDCMAAFAPIVQQSTIDYINDPAATNELIVQAVNEYNDFWVYDAELGAASVALQLELGLVSNGPDATLGNFDENRLTGFIEIAGPVFGVEGLTPADLVTNEYIDASIGLPVEAVEEPEAPATTEAPADAPSEEFVGIVQSDPATYTEYVTQLGLFGDEALGFLDAPHTAPSATPLRAAGDTLLASFPADAAEADSLLLQTVMAGFNSALQTSEDGDAATAVAELLGLQADATAVGGLILVALGAA
ncbi:MAG: hypothetical protein HOM89_00115, partial [Ilumatobacter sp.]|nr:hypothetical protein [Ilumatobacter sp.]